MDFYIQKQDIVKALSLTLGVVEKRQTLPILSNVLIEVEEGSMQLTATDLESQISTSSSVSNYTSGGKTTAPAKKLSELCRLLPDNSEIHITLDGDKLVIESGTGKYNLKTLISKTSFAMGNQDWRHYLNGLYITVEGSNILAVASDAHRLAIASTALDADSPNNMSGIIPRKSINEIAKLVSDVDGVVEVNLSSSSIKTSTPDAAFVSKLIEGKFPDYEQVIPSGDSSVLKVSTKDFSDALSRVSVLSSDKYRGVRMVTSSEGVMISANNPEQEEGEEFFNTNYEGEALDIAFNVNYFQEILSTLDDDECEIHFFGADKSCLITPPNSQHLKYVVMPLLI
jgi:DNA polymerase-3 subunit beta